MKLVKYFIILQLIAAGYSLFKFIITPIEEKITIQLSVFYMLMTWATFGMIWMTKIIIEDWYKLMGNKEE